MLEKMEQAPVFGLINRVNRFLDSKWREIDVAAFDFPSKI